MSGAGTGHDRGEMDDNAIQNAFREYAAAHENVDPQALAEQFLASLSQEQLKSLILDQVRATRRASEAFRKRAHDLAEQLRVEN